MPEIFEPTITVFENDGVSDTCYTSESVFFISGEVWWYKAWKIKILDACHMDENWKFKMF